MVAEGCTVGEFGSCSWGVTCLGGVAVFGATCGQSNH